MIDIELACGWRITGTTSRPSGLRVMDGDGNIVPGVTAIEIKAGPGGYPEIRLGMIASPEREPLGGQPRPQRRKCDNRFAHKAHDDCPGRTYDAT